MKLALMLPLRYRYCSSSFSSRDSGLTGVFEPQSVSEFGMVGLMVDEIKQSEVERSGVETS